MKTRSTFCHMALRACGLLAAGLLAAGLLTACQGEPATGAAPEQVVESYLEAKVSGDREAVQRLLCQEMEGRLEAEAGAFSSVSDVKIEGMACELAEEGLVRCQGKIVAAYGSEQTEFQLASYRVVVEDGAWKWCGETGG